MKTNLNQLIIDKRFSLPENVSLFPKANLVLDNGKFVGLGYFQENHSYSLLTIYKEKLEYIVLENLGRISQKYHGISLITIDDKRFAIIDNADTLFIFEDIKEEPLCIKINNKNILSAFSQHGQEPRVSSWGSAIGNNDGRYNITFSEPLQSSEERYIATLNIIENMNKAEWESIYSLQNEDYPKSPFGKFAVQNIAGEYLGKEPPIVGHTLFSENLYVFVEGSKYSSVNAYGMDFYTLAELDLNGKVKQKLYEVSGLKDGTKKYGVRGNFTSSTEYLIMTPVFKSDDWKGKQKLFSIKEKKLIDIQLPRGAKDFKIIEHKDGVFWLTDFYNEILFCPLEV